MRILTVGNLYPPHHFGGYELIWQSGVAHMRHAGHEVRVLTTDFRRADGSAARDEEPGVFRELGWYWVDGEFPRRSPQERLALERRNCRVLDRHLDEQQPDVVIWWPMGGMSLALIERVRNRAVPDMGVVGDDWMIYGPQVDGWMRAMSRPALEPLRGAIERLSGVPTRFQPACTPWIFISETVRQGTEAAVGSLPLSEVSHPGVDRRLFPPAPPPPWAWRLVYAGRIDERKGIDSAVAALARLPDEATLEIDGPGDERVLESLRAQVRELGLGDRVTFSKRPRDQLHELFGASDALIFPVRWEEPWGLVPLEAMSVGTPVVATGAGGSGEYLRHEVNCLLYDRERGAAGVAESVRRLAEGPALRAGLREQGYATADRFTETAFNEAVLRRAESAAGRQVSARRPRPAGS